jgi:hypothetical protein
VFRQISNENAAAVAASVGTGRRSSVPLSRKRVAAPWWQTVSPGSIVRNKYAVTHRLVGIAAGRLDGVDERTGRDCCLERNASNVLANELQTTVSNRINVRSAAQSGAEIASSDRGGNNLMETAVSSWRPLGDKLYTVVYSTEHSRRCRLRRIVEFGVTELKTLDWGSSSLTSLTR